MDLQRLQTYMDKYYRSRTMESPRKLFDTAVEALQDHPHVLHCLKGRPEVIKLPTTVACRASRGATEIVCVFSMFVGPRVAAEVKLKSLGSRIDYIYVYPEASAVNQFPAFCIRPAAARAEWVLYTMTAPEWGVFDEFKEQTADWDWEERPFT
eukprot:GEMP01062586.1.p1 GENE.GEMP01062586.1~~GEMP01062586.1.p1  ORF type:complete len:153 (+),score=30.79 GEMP01062586.1:506-964(+)